MSPSQAPQSGHEDQEENGLKERKWEMNYIEIKGHRIDGVVKVEMYNTDTDGVGGLAIKASDLWHWLSQCRPCQVHLRGRDYLLQRKPRATGWSISNVYVGMKS